MATSDCFEVLCDAWIVTSAVGPSEAEDWNLVQEVIIAKHECMLRTFEHKATGKQFYYRSEFDEDDDGQALPVGRIIYAIMNSEEGVYFAVNPESYWNDNGTLYDQHMSGWLEVLFPLPDHITGDEVQENMFVVEKSRNEVDAILTRAGLHHSQEMEEFLTQTQFA